MSYTPTHFRLPPNGILVRDDQAEPRVEPYLFDDAIAIALDVALATDRPLLVSGEPGCGKSRLAEAFAAVQGWNLLAQTITSRTRIETLTAEVDQLRRLNDAQARGPDDRLKPPACYLNPGLFWWAYAPDSARRRGLSDDEAATHGVELPYPGTRRDAPGQPQAATVLLIDEIDKAEPDLPNDLLEPLDRRRFDLPDGFPVANGRQIAAPTTDPGFRLLTLITTNGERDLPQAFLRRCVRLDLPDPTPERLIQIGEQHYPPGDDPQARKRIAAIARLIDAFRAPAKDSRQRRLPGLRPGGGGALGPAD